MASGSVKHLGLTLFSTGAHGATAKQEAASEGEDDKLSSKKFTRLTREAYEKGEGARAVNANLFFGRKIVDQSVRDTDAERRAAADKPPTLKVGDAHADWFAAKRDGTALMADVGAEIVKLESRHATIGIGPRVDTGIDVGKRGARVALLGVGGQAILQPNEDGKPARKRCAGFGFEFSLFKARFDWGGDEPTPDGESATAAGATSNTGSRWCWQAADPD